MFVSFQQVYECTESGFQIWLMQLTENTPDTNNEVGE